MRGVGPALLCAVVHVQALIPLGRLDAALGTDVVPMRSRRRGDGEKGPELVGEDVFVIPEEGRAWNALHEEVCARRTLSSRVRRPRLLALTWMVSK